MASLRALQQPPRPSLDYLHLHYQAESHVLHVRWQRPVSGAEFRQGYLAALAAAEAAGCPVWLIDVRARTSPGPDDTTWFSHEFLPQLPARLGSTVYLGMLLPPHYAAPVGPPHPVASAAISPFPQLIARSFEEEGAVLEWLANCQRGTPRRRPTPNLPVWPYWYGA